MACHRDEGMVFLAGSPLDADERSAVRQYLPKIAAVAARTCERYERRGLVGRRVVFHIYQIARKSSTKKGYTQVIVFFV